MKRIYSVLILAAALLLTLLYTFTFGIPREAQAATVATHVPTATPVPTKKTPVTTTPTPLPPPNIPLFIGVNNGKSLYDGDVWSWSVMQFSKRTNGGYNQLPVVSPTADWVVYLQVPDAYARLQPNHDNFPAPTDVYLLNIKTNQTTRITSQPKNILADYDNQIIRYTMRSEPSWSPDGKSLAWTEIAIDQPNNVNTDWSAEQLVIYDLKTKQQRTIIDKLPDHRLVGGGPLLSAVSWGPGGLLAVLNYTSADGVDDVFVYDVQGRLISHVPEVTTADPQYDGTQLIWLTGATNTMLSCVSCNTQINPQTGDLLPLPGTPEVYSQLAPNKLSMYFGNDSGTEGNVTWLVLLNGVQVSKFDSVRLAKLSDMGISPDGLQVAVANYAGQGSTAGVFIYRATAPDKPPVTVTLNVTGMGWGPLGWRVYPDLTQYF